MLWAAATTTTDHTDPSRPCRVQPGETPEQALERRLRESAQVEERVIDIVDQADWERQLKQVGGSPAGSANPATAMIAACAHFHSASLILCFHIAARRGSLQHCCRVLPPANRTADRVLPTPPATPPPARRATSWLCSTCRATTCARRGWRRRSCSGRRTRRRRWSRAAG